MFDKLMQVLVFGCGYQRVADHTCSERTLRRRRDEWIAAGVADQLHQLALAAYDRAIGLELDQLAIDGCITKAPCGGEVAGRSPVDRGKQGGKRSLAVDGRGIPLGVIPAPANRRDDGLLAATLDTMDALGPLPEHPTVRLDAGYDYRACRDELARRGLAGQIATRGVAGPVQAGRRWVVERSHAWLNTFGKLRWCTERRTRLCGVLARTGLLRGHHPPPGAPCLDAVSLGWAPSPPALTIRPLPEPLARPTVLASLEVSVRALAS